MAAQDDEIARLSIGDDVTPTLQSILDLLVAAEEAVTQFADASTNLDTITTAFDDILSALTLLEDGIVTGASATKILADAQAALDAIIATVTGTIQSAGSSLQAAAQATTDLTDADDTLAASQAAVAQAVTTTVQVLDPVAQALADIASIMADRAAPAADYFQKAILSISGAAFDLKPNLEQWYQQQLALAESSLSTAQAMLQLGAAAGVDAGAMSQLTGTVDALLGKVEMLQEAVGILGSSVQQTDNEFMNQLGVLDALNGEVTKSVEERLGLLQSIRDSADALYQEAEAAGASASALGQIANTAAQAAADFAELSAAVDANSGAMQGNAAATEEDTVAKDTNNESGMGSAYMLLFVGQMAVGAASRFLGMGVAADQSLTTLQAMTNSSAQQMQGFTATLENMAVQTGFGLKDLSDGMYYVVSASYSASDSISILDQAALLARAGNASLKDTTDALTTTLDAYGHHAGDAAHFSDVMTKAVKDGKQTFSDFTSAISVSAINAAAAGVSFDQLAAAESVLSLDFHNGQQAARDLSAMIRAVASDTSATTASLAKMGVGFDATSYNALNFTGRLEEINKLTNGNTAEFTKMIGGMGNAAAAMKSLDISTKTLATNARNLGISFDPVKFNAMNAAQQLQYLATISNNNTSTFAALTGGSANLNTALSHLNLSTPTVAAEAKKLGLTFDEAKYKSDTLVQKLQMLWDATGHNLTKFRSLTGGVYGANAALALIQGHGQQFTKTLGDMTHSSGTTKAAFDTAMTSWSAQSARAGASLQNLSYNVVALIKPAAAVFFAGLATAMQFLSAHADIVIPVIGALAAVIIAVLVPALFSMAAAALSLNAAMLPEIAVIAAVAFVILLLATHWGVVVAAMQPVIHVFQSVIAALRPLFSGIGAQLGTVLSGISKDFQQMGATLAPLLPALKVLGMIVGGVIVAAFTNMLAVVIGVVSGIASALATFIAGFMTVLGGVTHIIAGIVQVFSGLFTLIHGILTGNQAMIWQGVQQIFNGVMQIFHGAIQVVFGMFQMTFGTILSFLSGFVLGFLGFWRGLFSQISSMTTGGVHDVFAAIVSGFDAVISWVQGFINTIVQFFVGLWDDLVGHSVIPDMVSGILQWFQHLITQGEQFISNLVTGILGFFLHLELEAIIYINMMVAALIVEIQHLRDMLIQIILAMINWFLTNVLHMNKQGVQTVDNMVAGIISSIQGLVAKMAAFGADMIKQFASGITGAIGFVKGAIGNVVGFISGMLHHSKPDEGPLADDDQWMPDMIDMFVTGIDAGTGKLKAASARMAASVGSGINLSSSTSISMATSPIVQVLRQIHATLQQQQATLGSSPQPAGIASVTQQFGPVTISGSTAASQALYGHLNTLAGYAYEYGRRGATAGLPI